MKSKIGIAGIYLAMSLVNFGYTESSPPIVIDTSPFIDQQDIQALRDWIATKRQVSIKQIGGDLSLSGEIRTEFQGTSETQNGVKMRGPNSPNPNRPTQAYDVEVNLMLDYRADTSWGSIKIEFDNDAGTNKNVFDNISIERAYYGFRVVNKEVFTTDLELGRRNFGTVFDSRVQFGSFMDGILLRMDYATEKAGDPYLRAGPFLINEKLDQYGWVGEIGVLNILDTGLYAKFSVIDWDTKNFADPVLEQLYLFLNTQWTAGYKFVMPKLNQTVTLYGAYVTNHRARGVVQTRGKLENHAWYAGFSIGKVRKKWDWSMDINYQFVQAQAVPSFDASGIGMGNAANVGFYTVNANGTGAATTAETAFGRTNYKGLAAEFLFLFTDNITVLQSYSFSNNANKNIGPETHYSQYEVEVIYAF
jgi:hypothetical protein